MVKVGFVGVLPPVFPVLPVFPVPANLLAPKKKS